MITAIKRERWWLIANAFGIGAFMYFASRLWLEPELRGEDVGRAGDLFIGALTVLPIVALFFLVDVVWLSTGVARGLKSRDWRSVGVALVVAMAWLAAMIINSLNF